MEAVATATIQAWAAHLAVKPESIDPAALRTKLSEGSLPDTFARGAATHPQATVQVGNESVTQSELQRRVAQVATILGEEGVVHGSRVMICANSSISFVTCYLAALWAGASVILANPDYSDFELNKLNKASHPQLLVAEGRNIGDLHCVSLTDLVLRSDTAVEAEIVTISADDVALLAFTSGTTGSPKGVPLTHGNLLASIRAAMWAWRWSADDTLVHTLPLFHQHGLSGLHASLLAGSSLIVLDKFDPRKLIATINQFEATVLFGVPSIHHRLVGLSEDGLVALGQMRLITSGSAPLSPDLENSFNHRVGTQLLQRYGLTESGLNVSNPYNGERILGTVGLALPGVEVALFTADGDQISDAEGEICLRGPQIFSGYLDDAAATAAAFWPNGWFRTGDLGRWEHDRLVITGRLKELIISGGMNVAPLEVEIVLEQLPSISEAAVCGIPSERWGEQVAAWVVPTEPGDALDADGIINHCHSQLASYKCPKQVFVVRKLPRNGMGKIVRSSLSQMRPA